MTKQQARIIVNLADASINASATARNMQMHRNTILYHIEMIHRTTGKNPLNFYDLCKLLPTARKKLEEAR